VPSFGKFVEEFTKVYVEVQNKPSEQHSKEGIFRRYLLPAFENRRLDEIKFAHVETLKARLLRGTGEEGGLSPKTVNNALTCLSKVLRYAQELELIDSVPRIKILKVPPQSFDFLTDEEIARLLEASKTTTEVHAAILCGVDAGLRAGEIKALKWGDLDLKAGLMNVQRSVHRGIVTSPKSNRTRTVPLTSRLRNALGAVRHLTGEWVFSGSEGGTLTRHELDWQLKKACRSAQLRYTGWHALRHTFCSHLAMRGVSPRVIQELAGHSSITTTMRYMHLVPGVAAEAVRRLETSAALHPRCITNGDDDRNVATIRS
jgi:integrase